MVRKTSGGCGCGRDSLDVRGPVVETCACCILPGRHEKQRTIPPRNSQAGHPILDPRRSTAPLFPKRSRPRAAENLGSFSESQLGPSA